jgi:hypothetical protein
LQVERRPRALGCGARRSHVLGCPLARALQHGVDARPDRLGLLHRGVELLLLHVRDDTSPQCVDVDTARHRRRIEPSHLGDGCLDRRERRVGRRLGAGARARFEPRDQRRRIIDVLRDSAPFPVLERAPQPRQQFFDAGGFGARQPGRGVAMEAIPAFGEAIDRALEFVARDVAAAALGARRALTQGFESGKRFAVSPRFLQLVDLAQGARQLRCARAVAGRGSDLAELILQGFELAHLALDLGAQ